MSNTTSDPTTSTLNEDVKYPYTYYSSNGYPSVVAPVAPVGPVGPISPVAPVPPVGPITPISSSYYPPPPPPPSTPNNGYYSYPPPPTTPNYGYYPPPPPPPSSTTNQYYDSPPPNKKRRTNDMNNNNNNNNNNNMNNDMYMQPQYSSNSIPSTTAYSMNLNTPAKPLMHGDIISKVDRSLYAPQVRYDESDIKEPDKVIFTYTDIMNIHNFPPQYRQIINERIKYKTWLHSLKNDGIFIDCIGFDINFKWFCGLCQNYFIHENYGQKYNCGKSWINRPGSPHNKQHILQHFVGVMHRNAYKHLFGVDVEYPSWLEDLRVTFQERSKNTKLKRKKRERQSLGQSSGGGHDDDDDDDVDDLIDPLANSQQQHPQHPSSQQSFHHPHASNYQIIPQTHYPNDYNNHDYYNTNTPTSNGLMGPPLGYYPPPQPPMNPLMTNNIIKQEPMIKNELLDKTEHEMNKNENGEEEVVEQGNVENNNNNNNNNNEEDNKIISDNNMQTAISSTPGQMIGNYILSYSYNEQFNSCTQDISEKHIQNCQTYVNSGKLKCGGRTMNGIEVDGSDFIFFNVLYNEVIQFIEQDPFYSNGFVKDWKIHLWNIDCGYL